MKRQFNDRDRKKRVVAGDDQRIGRVRDVENERATVERSDDDETHELRREQVQRYENNEVHPQPRY